LGAGTFAIDTWYNIWMIINNSTNTYELWIDQGIYGTPGSALTHIADPNGADFAFGFRNGGTNPLITLLFAMGATTPALTGSLVVDDIYIDDSGANLNNPTVPEPGAAILLCFASAAGLISRRRRR
jgi:hypothetical protein